MKPCNQSLSEVDARDDDVALFREAMRGVKPLTESGKIVHSSLRRQLPVKFVVFDSPDRENMFSDGWQPDMAECGEWSFVRPGLQRHTLRKLRRGNWPVQDELDLHGLNRDEARQMLAEFLENCLLQQFRCVRIIHGRGLGSKDRKPVLKMLTRNWLMQHHAVLAFCQALPEHGGSGAVLILLKSVGK